MMKITFQGTHSQILDEIAEFLAGQPGYAHDPALDEPSQAAALDSTAKEAAKKVKEKEAPTAYPQAKKILEEAGVPEAEYAKIDRTGKGGKITANDAKAYVAIRNAPEEPEEPEKPQERDLPEPGHASGQAEKAPETASEAVTEAAEGANYNDAKAALQGVYTERGMMVSRATLTRFGAQRIADLKEEQFPEFVGYCRAVAKGKIDPTEALAE